MEKQKTKKVIIELKNVYKHYRMSEDVLVKAVDGVSLSVVAGEFVAIMGPSGSGKSTCMNLVGSLDVPTKGQVFLDGIDVSGLSESDLAQIRGRKIGFIFQSFNLIPNLTTLENVALPMMFQGVNSEERNSRAMGFLKLVELDDRAGHYPNELSGGQKQRVAIARSLANEPEVILADEPTGNLDSKTGKVVMDFLEKMNKDGRTIIMVTHDPDLAQKYADVVYWLKDGKVEKVTRRKNGKNGFSGDAIEKIAEGKNSSKIKGKVD